MTRLQSVLLYILKDIDILLRRYDIPYFLDGGTALGAIRHKGFIPWDDDLDICIMPEYYEKFVYVCRTKLDKEKYTFEEGEKDWPLPFSKIKLNGTLIEEVDAYPTPNKGIYIDIFCPDYARKSYIGKYWQFLFGRLFTACFLSRKPYTTNSIAKKLILTLARQINKYPTIYRWVHQQARWNKKSTQLAITWDRHRSNWTKYFYDRVLFDSEIMMDFEDCKFPVCKGYDEYLTKMYGNYMQLPPEEKRVGLHTIKVEFGVYENIDEMLYINPVSNDIES